MDVGFEIGSSTFSLGKLNRGHWCKAGFLGEYNLPPASHPWNEGNLNEFPKVSVLPNAGREGTSKIFLQKNITYLPVFVHQGRSGGSRISARASSCYRGGHHHAGNGRDPVDPEFLPPGSQQGCSSLGCQLNPILSSPSTDPIIRAKAPPQVQSRMTQGRGLGLCFREQSSDTPNTWGNGVFPLISADIPWAASLWSWH